MNVYLFIYFFQKARIFLTLPHTRERHEDRYMTGECV